MLSSRQRRIPAGKRYRRAPTEESSGEESSSGSSSYQEISSSSESASEGEYETSSDEGAPHYGSDTQSPRQRASRQSRAPSMRKTPVLDGKRPTRSNGAESLPLDANLPPSVLRDLVIDGAGLAGGERYSESAVRRGPSENSRARRIDNGEGSSRGEGRRSVVKVEDQNSGVSAEEKRLKKLRGKLAIDANEGLVGAPKVSGLTRSGKMRLSDVEPSKKKKTKKPAWGEEDRITVKRPRAGSNASLQPEKPAKVRRERTRLQDELAVDANPALHGQPLSSGRTRNGGVSPPSKEEKAAKESRVVERAEGGQATGLIEGVHYEGITRGEPPAMVPLTPGEQRLRSLKPGRGGFHSFEADFKAFWGHEAEKMDWRVKNEEKEKKEEERKKASRSGRSKKVAGRTGRVKG